MEEKGEVLARPHSEMRPFQSAERSFPERRVLAGKHPQWFRALTFDRGRGARRRGAINPMDPAAHVQSAGTDADDTAGTSGRCP